MCVKMAGIMNKVHHHFVLTLAPNLTVMVVQLKKAVLSFVCHLNFQHQVISRSPVMKDYQETLHHYQPFLQPTM